MRIEIPRPDPREDGDYGVWVTSGYGDPCATIHLAATGIMDLRDVRADDCDRLIRAAAKAKDEILRYQAQMTAPHGRNHVYQGTCQLCGQPEDDPLHADPASCPSVFGGEPCTVTRAGHRHHYGPDRGAGIRTMWTDDDIAREPSGDDVTGSITDDEPLPPCARPGCGHPEAAHFIGDGDPIATGACDHCGGCGAYALPKTEAAR